MRELERINDPEELLRTALDGMRAGLWTALPGIVESFDASAMTVVVQPAIKATITAPDGTTTTEALPLLLDCPVVFPSGGGFTLTFPVAQGDECLVVFASRCIDAWWQSGGVQEQAEFRMHDLSDGFALVGVRSQVRRLTGVSTNSAQLRSDDGESYVEMADGHVVNIVAPGGINLNGVNIDACGNISNAANIDATGTITASHINGVVDVSFGGKSGTGHRHGGVTTGSGNTGVTI